MCFKCGMDTKTDTSSSMVDWPNHKHMTLHMKLYTECLSIFVPVIYLVRLHDLGALQKQPSHTKWKSVHRHLTTQHISHNNTDSNISKTPLLKTGKTGGLLRCSGTIYLFLLDLYVMIYINIYWNIYIFILVNILYWFIFKQFKRSNCTHNSVKWSIL